MIFSFSLPLSADVSTNDSLGMAFACWSIIIVIAAVFFVFMKARKKEYAFAILPLVFVPFMHIFGVPLAKLLEGSLPLHFIEIRVIFDILAALIACLFIGGGSRGIAEKRSRRTFFLCCSAFIIILTLVLITNLLVASRT